MQEIKKDLENYAIKPLLMTFLKYLKDYNYIGTKYDEESIANEFLINSNDKKYIEYQKKVIDIQTIYDILNKGSDLQIKSLDVNDENFMIAFKKFRKNIKKEHEAILEKENEG